jgi:hypothetical protein
MSGRREIGPTVRIFFSFGSAAIALWAGRPEVFLQTPAIERSAALSPDGHWLAYASNESGTYQIYVRAFPDKGGKWQISNSGAMYPPMWSRTAHELFFETPDARQIMVAAYTVKGDSFAAEKPRLWSEAKLGSIGGPRNIGIAPDGQALRGVHARRRVQRSARGTESCRLHRKLLRRAATKSTHREIAPHAPDSGTPS